MLKDIAKMSRQWINGLVAALLLLAPGVAAAQNTSFGDWAKQCEPVGGGAERCYLVQTVKADDKPVMVIVVAYSPGRERVAAMIDVPLGMHLPTGLEVKAAGVIKKIEFEQCLPTGCRAMLPMDDAILGSLKNGDAAAIAGRGRDGESVELPISATGFSEAFGAL